MNSSDQKSASTGLALQVLGRYGRVSAGDRVRVFDWLDHTGIDADCFSFDSDPVRFGTEAIYRSPLGTLAKHMKSVNRARTISSESNVLLYREMSPISHGEIEQMVIRRARHTTFDLDDANFFDTGGGIVRSKLFSKARKATLLAGSCQRVIAGNDYIANWAESLCSDVRVIPSCVEPGKYQRKVDYELDKHPKAVWIGSFSTERYLAPLTDVFRRLNSQFGLTLTVISSAGVIPAGFEGIMERNKWSESSAFQTLSQFDLGIMPLPDDSYERGKCGYKLLQYGAAGLPLIGSPVGVNSNILEKCGAPAPSTADDWYDSLKYLITSTASAREALGMRAFDIVERDFSFGSWQNQWIDAVS